MNAVQFFFRRAVTLNALIAFVNVDKCTFIPISNTIVTTSSLFHSFFLIQQNKFEFPNYSF